MELESADVHRLSVPMRGSYGSAHHREFTTMESTLVVLTDTDGRRGIGTADATPGYSRQTHDDIQRSLTDHILPSLLDRNPRHPNGLDALLREFHGIPNAKCAVEMAWLDLYCRRDDRPLHGLLNGPLQERVALNGWVGIDTPAEMASEARTWRDDGYQSVKIKLSGDPEGDIERVQAVCDAVADEMQVRADVNAGYDVETAIDVARRLESLPLVHLEQPVPKDDIAGLAAVTESTTTTIMADECIQTAGDAFEVLKGEAADRIKVKALRLGGLFGTRRVQDAADLAGVECVLGHGFGLTPATSAELQLAATQSNVFEGVECVGPLKMQVEPFEPAIDFEDGTAVLPDGPGLGVDLAGDELDEFVTQSARVER
ncbi:mandelate racemase/muconate lactonizing enzyme family protein [Halorussus halophilus]|uniref:mandelate racemase/muconate lactonizing enzyme family protein n=1 Tax=Halorussus halophilus TaxID=2650975 RepID=UPI0013016617|nr:enolase C-terminal domain-like protein [Halorussus halophilus]